MPFDLRADWDKFYSFNAEPWGRPNTRPGIRSHYNWYVVGEGQVQYASQMAATLGGVNGANIILVGAGFGWTGQGFADLGATVIGTDLSQYIQDNKDQTEEADLRDYITAAGVNPDTDLIIGPDGQQTLDPLDFLLKGRGGGRGGRSNPSPRKGIEVINEDLRTNGSWNAVVNQIGGTVDHIISEEVLNSLTDAEALQACEFATNGANRFGAVVTHILSPLQPDARQAPELNWKTYDDWRAFLDANGFSSHRIMPSVSVQGRVQYGELF